ncbi:hypothetical protein GBA52_027398 [Prunus armeniaca]|nr:hypothetical protein GBA52_027398 [Prunus armeniaca]
MEQIVHFDDYFKQKPDAIRKLGFSPQVKMTATLRMLLYGTTTDLNDDYLNIPETTSFEACKRFCHAVNNLYEAECLLERLHMVNHHLHKWIHSLEKHSQKERIGTLQRVATYEHIEQHPNCGQGGMLSWSSRKKVVLHQ